MEFTQRDMAILISMPLAIIMLNFAFSGLGMADDSVEKHDIPKYDIPEDRFDLISDMPDKPANPSSGTLRYYYEKKNIDDNVRYLDSSLGLEGAKIFITDNFDGSRETIETNISVEGVGGASEILLEKGDTTQMYIKYTDGSETVNTTVEFIHKGLKNDSIRSDYVEVYYKISRDNTDNAWFEGIPVIGSVVSTGADIAQAVYWVGSIISWIIQAIYSISIAMILTVYDSIIFGLELINWILTSYNSIVTNAKGFASIFVILPGLLLSLELLKVGFIMVHLLPTT